MDRRKANAIGDNVQKTGAQKIKPNEQKDDTEILQEMMQIAMTMQIDDTNPQRRK